MSDTKREQDGCFPGEFPDLADENRRMWNANARCWDDRIGDGNRFQERDSTLVFSVAQPVDQFRSGFPVVSVC